MKQKAEFTIWVMTSQEVLRADYSGVRSPRLVHFDRRPRTADDASGLQTISEHLAERPQIGRRNLILDTAIWSQLISVPRLSVIDVEQEELQTALKYEIETLTGIESHSSMLGAIPVRGSEPEDEATFWVNIATTNQYQDLKEGLQAHRARWVGLAHPAGCSRDASGPLVAEAWEDQIYQLEQGMLRNVAPASSEWFRQLGFETMVECQQRGQPRFAMESAAEPEWKRWLQGVAEGFAGDQVRQAPLIIDTPRASASWIPSTVLKLAVAAVVGVLCFLHWQWLHQQCLKTAREMVALRQPAIAKQKADGELARVLEQRAELERDSQAIQYQVKQVEFLMEHQTARLSQLLTLLGDSRSSDLVIRSLEPNELGLMVKGLSLNGKSVALLANRIRDDALALGWHIHAPTQEGEKKMINGGPWIFSLQLEAVGPDFQPSQALATETHPRSNGSL